MKLEEAFKILEELKLDPKTAALIARMPEKKKSYSLYELSTHNDDFSIKALTAEQEEQIVVFRDDWLAVLLSTAPANRIAGVYPNGSRSVWTESPFGGIVTVMSSNETVTNVWVEKMVAARDVVIQALAPDVFVKIRERIFDVLVNRAEEIVSLIAMEISNRIAASKIDKADAVAQMILVNSTLYNNHDAAFLAFYDYCHRVLGITALADLDELISVARSSGWFWLLATHTVVSERPCKLLFDDANKLHSNDRLAVEYPDGFGLCAWHGVRVPAEAVLTPDAVAWDAVEALQDKELRAALAEIKALRWSGGDEEGNEFAAALAVKRLGGVESVKALTESDAKK